MRTNEPGPYFRISLVGDAGELPRLSDVLNFLYDVNVVYEVSRLATDPSYRNFEFRAPFVFYRTGRPLRDADRLHLSLLHEASPLELTTVLWGSPLAVAAIYGLVQAVEQAMNIPMNRRKLRAEVEKLERENADAAPHLASQVQLEDSERFHDVLRRREADAFYDQSASRLRRATVKITEIDVEVINDLDPRNRRR